MDEKQRKKLYVAKAMLDGKMTVSEGVLALDLSERQVKRIKAGVKEYGDAFVIHKNTNRKPSHATTDDVASRIIALKNNKYPEANFLHFTELLERLESIKISYSSVYRILTKEGLKSPKKHRKRKTHHRRKRKAQKGMLVQIDASPHVWIIGGERMTLHGAIDDATGEILALFFTKNECMEGYFEIIRQIITNHGIPLNIYCDRHTIFISPNDGKVTIEQELDGKTINLTQFGRAMDDLGINIIKAKSAQAKGRIERLWETLQSRIPVEFKVYGIDSIDAANSFLSEFMDLYNSKFSVLPENPVSVFRQLDTNIVLDHILCKKEGRTVDNGAVFSYYGSYYQLVKNGKRASVIPKSKVEVLESDCIGIKALYSGVVYETQITSKPVKKSMCTQKPKPKHVTIPSESHPWKQSGQTKPRPSYVETDQEILQMIDDLFSSRRAWA